MSTPKRYVGGEGMRQHRSAISGVLTVDERWGQIRRRIEKAAPQLASQGALIAKSSAGRRVWVIRFRDQKRLRSIYVAGDEQPELVRRTQWLLAEIRGPSQWPREIAKCAQFAKALSSLARRST